MATTSLARPRTGLPNPVPTNFRREFHLLAKAAYDSEVNLGEMLSDPALDWDYLLEAARFHGLIPVLAPRLLRQVSSLPPRVRTEIQEASRRALEGTLSLSGELVRILRSLNAAHIECLPFKGPALAAELWGNFTLRQSMDIDLLIRPDQLVQAVEVLSSCGYSPEPEAGWKKLLPAAVELPMKKPGMPPLELQWGIAPRCFAVDFSMSECWQRARPYEFGGQSTLAFAPEDLLMVLCIHGWKHAWNRLLWAADVARVLRKSTALNWEALLVRAKASGTANILLLGVEMAEQLFAAPVPAEIEDAAGDSRTIRMLASESIGYMQTLTQPTYAGWHRYMLLARERTADRVRHISRFVLTPSTGEWEAVRLPQVLAPLYRVIRLARVGQVAAQYAFRRS